MLKPIFDFMEKISTDFSWRRLSVFLSFLFLVGLLISIYEYYTSHFYLGKLEYSLQLLQEIEELEKSKVIENDKVLSNTLDAIKNDLASVIQPSDISIQIGSGFKQFFAAFAPWLLMIIFSVFFNKNVDTADATLGFIIIGVPFAIIGSLLPLDWGFYTVYVIYPIGHFAIIAAFILLIQKRKAT